MTWVEQELKTRNPLPMTPERARLLDEVKSANLPVIVSEATHGNKAVTPIDFKQVKSPGLFEAEFAQKDTDVIFHIWPWGLHLAEREGQPRPAFKPNFYPTLVPVMSAQYAGHRLQIEQDRDMGAYFVRAVGAGMKQFWYELAIKALTALHKGLGGAD